MNLGEDSWIYLVIGAVFILLSLTGLVEKSRRSQWLVRLIGSIGVKIFYIVLGIVFIILGLFVIK
jgi:threonine/homoserine/homoserine lactone efflux protein